MREFNEKEIKREAAATVENYLEDMMFYLDEYGKDSSDWTNIAGIFCAEYICAFSRLVEDFERDEEGEE